MAPFSETLSLTSGASGHLGDGWDVPQPSWGQPDVPGVSETFKKNTFKLEKKAFLKLFCGLLTSQVALKVIRQKILIHLMICMRGN